MGWPWDWEKKEKEQFHRWITRDDPTLVDYVYNEHTGVYQCKTPNQFQGLRNKGHLPGSSRLQFTLPGKDDEPKTLELMRSDAQDNPSFGAVKVTLPIDVVVLPQASRLVIKTVKRQSNAEQSRLRGGDIIRAVSVPEDTEGDKPQAETPWWSRIGELEVSDAEEGMVILDGT